MKQLFLFLFLAFASGAGAADVEFVVYFSQGKVSKSGGSKPLAVKKGDRLFGGDELQLAEGAQVVLICKNYNTLQLKKKGRYTMAALQAGCRKGGGSFTSSYFRYIWDELTHVHGTPEKDPKKYMRNTGAVSRGCAQVQTGVAVDTVHYLSGSLPVSWRSSFPAPYIRVYDDPIDGMLLRSEPLGAAPLQIEQIASALKGEGVYFWQVTDAEGEGCERNYLRLWKADEYKRAVDRLLEDVLATTPAETAYLKGYVLEEQHFLAEAYAYYRLAARLHPQHRLYKKTVARFL